jgi:hypothetical protein
MGSFSRSRWPLKPSRLKTLPARSGFLMNANVAPSPQSWQFWNSGWLTFGQNYFETNMSSAIVR